jgi:hypothetical protein
MGRWLGLLLFALAFVVGAFGVAVLALEWRDDDVKDVSNDLEELRAEVRELRRQVVPVDDTSPVPPTPTATPVVLAAKAGASVDLQGMRLTMTALTPRRHDGSADFALENLDAPADEARANALEFKSVNYGDFICDTDSQAPDVSLAPGEKVSFTVSWSCPNSPPRSLNVDDVIFTLPVIPPASGD